MQDKYLYNYKFISANILYNIFLMYNIFFNA